MIANFSNTTQKGDSFRDAIGQLLSAAGYTVTPEKLVDGKKVDLYATKKERFRERRYAFEAKDYSGALPIDVTRTFTMEYCGLLQNHAIDEAYLITRDGLTSQGIMNIEANSNKGIGHYTWSELQRGIFSPDEYPRGTGRGNKSVG